MATLKPTQEQIAAVNEFLKGKNLVVNAFAGTGKTTTLLSMAQAAKTTGIYLAFNRSIAAEVKAKAKHTNLQSFTTHSMAMRWCKDNHDFVDGKLFDSLNHMMLVSQGRFTSLQVNNDFTLDEYAVAFLVVKTITIFCNSAEEIIEPKAVPLMGYLLGIPKSQQKALADKISKLARGIWSEMVDPKGSVPLGHDGYLKLWTLAAPQITASYVLLDEAQDTNDAVLSLLAKQQTQVVYVGDKYQQIYEWRGAVNALDKVKTHSSSNLTQSFRFGQSLADLANKILYRLGEPLAICGNPTIDTKIGEIECRTLLSRTNASVLTNLVSTISSGKKPHILGGTAELERLLKDIGRLKKGLAVSSSELFGFKSWSQVVAFSKRDEGEHLVSLVNIVETFGEQQLLGLLEKACPDESNADIVLSTVHKAKGREWDTVRVSDDFSLDWADEQCELAESEEARLLYVAITRAKTGLNLPSSIASSLDKLKSPEPRYHEVAKASPIVESIGYDESEQALSLQDSCEVPTDARSAVETVYLDTETTGLHPSKGDRIVEIAIVDDEGTPLLDTLVNPERPIPYQASNIHGITESMVTSAPTIGELLPSINDIIRGKQVVIYNSNYDIAFFEDRLSQAAEIHCAMREFTASQGGGKWIKLSTAAEIVGHSWAGENAHRAKADCLAARSVWRYLRSSIPVDEPPDINAELSNTAQEAELDFDLQLHQGKSYFFGDSQERYKAFECFSKAAKTGNAEAQFFVGRCLSEGCGVFKSNVEALNWYTLAAEQGFAEAQLYLGCMYDDGETAVQDLETAFAWYLKAAEQFNETAQYNVGYCYELGEGVEQDYEQARKWYSLVAKNGDLDAHVALGRIYLHGLGVETNLKEAVQWYGLAANRGHSIPLDECEDISQWASFEQSDYELAFEAQMIAANGGCLGAQFKIAEMFHDGKGTGQDFQEALHWYSKAAESGHEFAQFNLAVMYAEGRGTQKDLDQAFRWFHEAAKQGHDAAQCELGQFYVDGLQVTQDYETAIYWWTKAVENGNSDAQTLIDQLYQKTLVSEQPANSNSNFTIEDDFESGSSLPTSNQIMNKEKLFDLIAEELDSGKVKKGLWLRAEFESDGDEKQTRLKYTQLRLHEELPPDARETEKFVDDLKARAFKDKLTEQNNQRVLEKAERVIREQHLREAREAFFQRTREKATAEANEKAAVEAAVEAKRQLELQRQREARELQKVAREAKRKLAREAEKLKEKEAAEDRAKKEAEKQKLARARLVEVFIEYDAEILLSPVWEKFEFLPDVIPEKELRLKMLNHEFWIDSDLNVWTEAPHGKRSTRLTPPQLSGYLYELNRSATGQVITKASKQRGAKSKNPPEKSDLLSDALEPRDNSPATELDVSRNQVMMNPERANEAVATQLAKTNSNTPSDNDEIKAQRAFQDAVHLANAVIWAKNHADFWQKKANDDTQSILMRWASALSLLSSEGLEIKPFDSSVIPGFHLKSPDFDLGIFRNLEAVEILCGMRVDSEEPWQNILSRVITEKRNPRLMTLVDKHLKYFAAFCKSSTQRKEYLDKVTDMQAQLDARLSNSVIADHSPLNINKSYDEMRALREAKKDKRKIRILGNTRRELIWILNALGYSVRSLKTGDDEVVIQKYMLPSGSSLDFFGSIIITHSERMAWLSSQQEK